jgi:hypothetical protein
VEVPTTRAGLRQLRSGLDAWLDRLDPADADRGALELAVWEAVPTPSTTPTPQAGRGR